MLTNSNTFGKNGKTDNVKRGTIESSKICLEICIKRYLEDKFQLHRLSRTYFLNSMLAAIHKLDFPQINIVDDELLNDIVYYSIWGKDWFLEGGYMHRLLLNKYTSIDYFCNRLAFSEKYNDETMWISLIEIGGKSPLQIAKSAKIALNDELVNSTLKVYDKTVEDILTATNLFRDLCLVISSF
jgi:hypothetical protein